MQLVVVISIVVGSGLGACAAPGPAPVRTGGSAGDSTLAAAPPPAPAPEPSVPVAATVEDPASPWWCLSFNDNQNGFCHLRREDCQAKVAALRRVGTTPPEVLPDCAPQPHAVCFDAQSPSTGAETLCHPTFAICRTHVDHFYGVKSSQALVMSECRSTAFDGDASWDPEASTSWWCLAFPAVKLGSCHRSRAACVKDRAFLLSRVRPGDRGSVSECAPQQTALCFELEDIPAGTRRNFCQPDQQICESTASFHRKESKGKRVSLGCRPME